MPTRTEATEQQQTADDWLMAQYHLALQHGWRRLIVRPIFELIEDHECENDAVCRYWELRSDDTADTRWDHLCADPSDSPLFKRLMRDDPPSQP